MILQDLPDFLRLYGSRIRTMKKPLITVICMTPLFAPLALAQSGAGFVPPLYGTTAFGRDHQPRLDLASRQRPSKTPIVAQDRPLQPQSYERSADRTKHERLD